jgi:hypothetical protein
LYKRYPNDGEKRRTNRSKLLIYRRRQGNDGLYFKANAWRFEGRTNLAASRRRLDIEDCCWDTVRKVELVVGAVVVPTKMGRWQPQWQNPPGADWQSLATTSSDPP